MSDLPDRIVLFDGDCAVCDATVRFLLDHDRDRRLHFAPLQGPTAQAVRARHPEWPANLDSLVYVERIDGTERLSWYTTGVLRMLAVLPVPWRWLAVLQGIPAPLRDPFYRAFAAIRLRVFGRVTSCRLPTAAEASQLLA